MFFGFLIIFGIFSLCQYFFFCYTFLVKTKERTYIAYLAADCRRRHSRKYIGKWIIGFCVQLEFLIDNKWIPIIRYDSSHAFVHRDYIHPDGKVEKTPIIAKDFNDALTFSENDIKINWESYKEKFMKEKEKRHK